MVDFIDSKSHRDNLLPELLRLFNILGDVRGKSVLEIGPGFDRQIRNELENIGLVYTATDNEGFLGNQSVHSEEYSKRYKSIGAEYHSNSMDDLKDFVDESFDFVVAVHSFEHCENPLKALREFRRILKWSGRVILVTPFPCKHQIIDADPDHIFVLNDLQFAKLLAYAGFLLVNSYVIREWNLKEQDWNVFSIGIKVKD